MYGVEALVRLYLQRAASILEGAIPLCRDRDTDRKRRRDEDTKERGGRKEAKDGDGMSIAETNAMRAKLGLKPLK